MNVLPPKMPALYAKQRAAIFAPERYSIIEASTKCGKTAGCLIWLLVAAWNDGKPGRNYWWVAPIFPQAKMAYNRMKRMLTGSDNHRRVWSSNETELWIEITGRGRIWFKSADNPDSLYGEDVYGCVVDEASRCKDSTFYAIRSTLTSTGGSLRIIGNVRGRKNWAYNLARKAEAGEPNMAYFRLTAYDAVDGGILSLAEVEDAKRMLPDHVFRELYLGEPADDGGNPFGLQALKACEVDGLSLRDPIAFGVDLAKSFDWCVACGLDDCGAVCGLERWQSDWQQTRGRIVQVVDRVPALIDSTGVGDPIVEDLCRTMPNASGFKFSSSSKQQLMEGLASAIQQRRVQIPVGWLMNELEAFEYIYTASGVRYSAPAGLHDDGVCALALAVRQLQMNKVDRVILNDSRPVIVY